MKPVLMIHEIGEWMFDLPLEQYILTFDDGLYSQFFYLEKFKNINTEKIFFISTEIVCEEDAVQSTQFVDCRTAHLEYFETKNKTHYMKWSQIKKIQATPQCFIGGHSHGHLRQTTKSIKDLYDILLTDTQNMMTAFSKQAISINKFCYPYNEKYPLYEGILKKFGLSEFYGEERIPIDVLRKS